ncbi:Ail/Lom family outer membrane beta-barrel protein [Escherichia coli]|uniref:Ail/Lom family outer membrane beta-barrel protein n=1 Tax=Escherichia coli TaxID=562 RepID=UPI0033656521
MSLRTPGAGDVIQLCRRQESPATRYSDTRWHEDSVRNRWFSVMAGPSVRVNEWFSAYAMAGMAYSRVRLSPGIISA